jgi:hypothetical protein
MIVWGGYDGSVYRSDGAAYDPATNSWSAINSSGAPAARSAPAFVWTGSRMLVWGGRGTSYYSDGASYDAGANTWSASSNAGAPAARYLPSTVWTGTRMVVWGGLGSTGALGDGAAYDPAWTPPPPVPTITGFLPASGGVGATVTITGTGLTDASEVLFNGTSASFSVFSDSSITTTVPAGAASGPLSVTTPGGNATSATSFIVIPAPTITSFSPRRGSVGSVVEVTGTNLTGATALTFAGTAADFTVDSPTAITAIVPGGATSGPIAVATPGGMATSADSFVVAPPSLALHTVLPCRVFDSREPSLGGPDPLLAGATASLAVAGRCGIPTSARSVAVNLTVTAPTAPGHLTAYPNGTVRPTTSVVNFRPGDTRANNAVLTLGADGSLAVFSGQQTGSVHFVVDVNGYFE